MIATGDNCKVGQNGFLSFGEVSGGQIDYPFVT